MYFPFATDGFALMTLVISVVAFSINFSGENEILPTGTCTSAVLSVRNSTLPAFTSCTARATSNVTVPVFGFGINPQSHGDFNRFVELREFHFLQQRHGLLQRIRTCLDRFPRFDYVLSRF